jgi:Na+-transporting NADH:ubiquinone oxidoreductase subunit E
VKFLIIILSSAIINNISLTYFLGTCPFIALSKNVRAAFGMGVAVTFVIVVTAAVNHILYYNVLLPLGVDFLSFVVFILSIAAIVQLLEIFIERFLPALYMAFGIFLPLITVNCAILGVSLFMILREYEFLDALAYSFGSGVGWMLAITAMAGLRKYLALSRPVRLLGEAGITLVLAGFMALAFLGFTGMLN